ncbi:MAG: B12-binding domain-containing radical SAM protein, partial [Clostridia bacterium]|nr:B12-binding domain-containing radical SAM protein [Clostridia bacterium]
MRKAGRYVKKPIRAVICGINSQYIHSSLAPWCLLAGIREYADPQMVSASVLEGTINETDDVLLERLLAAKADVIGFCCYIWNVPTVLRLCVLLKQKNPDIRIVLGGPEVAYRTADLLQATPAVDYVLSGEGELPFAQLLTALADNNDLGSVSGISYRDGGKIVAGEPYVTDDVPPSPYCEEYFKALQGRIAYLETSRGCPFSCAFCLSGRCGNVRYFTLERAQQDILKLAQSGAKTIKFVDRTFNANRARALELIRFILTHYGREIPTDVCFHFEIAGDLLDEETITVLSEAPAGLFLTEIGVQSFHAPTLSAIARKTDMER